MPTSPPSSYPPTIANLITKLATAARAVHLASSEAVWRAINHPEDGWALRRKAAKWLALISVFGPADARTDTGLPSRPIIACL